MKFVSTNVVVADEPFRTWSFREALFQGQAPDGGLFVPESLTPLPARTLRSIVGRTFQECAFTVAEHLLGDELPKRVLRDVVHKALDFPVPVRRVEPQVRVLELFHGPTYAFKDVGARFMARMMSALRPGSGRPLTVLVATSGDTGGAVAQAFYDVPGVRVVVLYPRGKVSPRQEVQFCTLGRNISAVAVEGVFDDCQRLVQEAFSDRALNSALGLVSANSINIGAPPPPDVLLCVRVGRVGSRIARRTPI